MYLVIGLGFGDEGKGTLIDTLSRLSAQVPPHSGRAAGPPTVIRFNGGPQAAHHVVTTTGQSHCFAQFGSGSLCSGAKTLLSRHMLIEPMALLREAKALHALNVKDPLLQLSIDERCVVVTPFHKLLNRMQEVARGSGRHGSCGLGVGQAWLDSRNPSVPSLGIGEARDPARLRRKLSFLQLVQVDRAEQLVDAHKGVQELGSHLREMERSDWVEALVAVYSELLQRIAGLDDGAALANLLKDPVGQHSVLFEGAQGVLLDAEHGFWPHVSPSYTTFRNALELLAESRSEGRPLRLGVLRAYGTRHGPGPFVTEDMDLQTYLPERHNLENPWQGAMRIGWFDAVAARYAITAAGGVDQVALTNLDRLSGLPRLRVCVGYRDGGGTAAGSVLHHLPVAPGPSRAQQAELTRRLASCVPIYEELPGFPSALKDGHLSPAAADFVRFLESPAGLGVPIAIVSVGPTSADKLFLHIGH
jgi:adenylosuccinate synthase